MAGYKEATFSERQEEAQKATASIDSSFKQVATSLQEVAQQASGEVSTAAPEPPSAPVWSASGWGSHRFRTRARPGPSLSDLAEAVEQLRGRTVMPGVARFGANRYAPRSRVNRPRIHR